MINYYTVQNDLSEKGWTLLAEEYKNLKTPILMRCPKGHIVELTFDDWRKRQLCPECQKSIGAERNKLPDPNPAAYRVLALDAATGTTGWSIFDNGKLIAYGTFMARQTDEATARIDQVKKWMENVCEKCKPDFVGIEDIQFQKNIIIFKTLANLQGVLENALYERGLPFAFTNSSSWRSFLGINEGDKRDEAKKHAQTYVSARYSVRATQDEADAICLGCFFANKYAKKKSSSWGEDIL